MTMYLQVIKDLYRYFRDDDERPFVLDDDYDETICMYMLWLDLHVYDMLKIIV